MFSEILYSILQGISPVETLYLTHFDTATAKEVKYLYCIKLGQLFKHWLNDVFPLCFYWNLAR